MAVKVEQQLSLIQTVMIGIVIVFFMGFVQLLFAQGAVLKDYMNDKNYSYRELGNKVEEQNKKIEDLTKQVHDSNSKLDVVSLQLSSLKLVAP
jgi:hypothetical protein